MSPFLVPLWLWVMLLDSLSDATVVLGSVSGGQLWPSSPLILGRKCHSRAELVLECHIGSRMPLIETKMVMAAVSRVLETA